MTTDASKASTEAYEALADYIAGRGGVTSGDVADAQERARLASTDRDGKRAGSLEDAVTAHYAATSTKDGRP